MTQLYVSVDAGSKEELKRIDRPLFRDFWQRYLDSLEALGEKVWHMCFTHMCVCVCVSVFVCMWVCVCLVYTGVSVCVCIWCSVCVRVGGWVCLH